jgi:cellulose synthase/poly-beta-1,6-N-acetylglucosamine synthase-like glycosyltransferase
MQVVFWLCAGALGWAFAGYPASVGVRAGLVGWRRRRAAARPSAIPDARLPSVTVILAVRNAAGEIEARLQNLVEQRYPVDRYEIVVVCNGCTDGTLELAEAFAARHAGRVRVLTSDAAAGKAGALNAGAAAARGEILVFADARQRFDADAIRRLASGFGDPAVGAISGRLIIEDGDAQSGGVRSVSRYWQMETMLRLAESRTGSVVGVTGAIYAMRRALFSELPPGTILDDVYQPMRVVLQGYRVLLEMEAVAYDRASVDVASEYRRRVRTLVGNVELLRLLPELLVPWRNPIFVRYHSHKLLRVLAPVFFLGMLVTALMLRGPVYGGVAATLAGAYLLGLIGLVRPWRGLALPTAFVMLHTAALSALLRPRRRAADLWR